MTIAKLKITIEGPTGSGKTQVANALSIGLDAHFGKHSWTMTNVTAKKAYQKEVYLLELAR